MDAFAAIADPTRRQIVTALAAGEQSFGELADRFSMSRPAVSQHLKVLKEAQIVTSRPDAQRRVYSLNEDALDDVEQWIATVRQFWSSSFDNLERLLLEEEGEEQ